MKKTIALFLLAAMLLFCLRPVSAARTVKYTGLFEEESVMEIDFQVDSDVWQRMLDHAMDKEVICCNVSVDGEMYYSVGVNCKGNSSLAATENGRYSLRVTFDEYVHQQSLWGLDKILLNNMFSDPTYIKEYLSYKLFEAMGVPSPLFRLVHVTVNGKDYGLMLAVEAMEDDFEARVFGTEAGNLYKVETMDFNGRPLMSDIIPQERQRRGVGEGFWNDFSDRTRPTVPADTMAESGQEGKENVIRPNGADLKYTDGVERSYSAIFNGAESPYTAADAARLIECIRVLNEGSDEEIAQCFDVDEILMYLAVNTFLVNTDHYTGKTLHNYCIYEYRGRVSILPWDYNLSFGTALSGGAGEFVNFPIDTPLDGAEMSERPLVERLLGNAAWLETYHACLEKVLSYLEGGAFEAEVERLRALLSSHVAEESNPFYAPEGFDGALDELKALTALRIKSVRGQLEGTIPSTREEQGEDPSLLLNCTGRDLTLLGQWQAETALGPEEALPHSTPGAGEGMTDREMAPAGLPEGTAPSSADAPGDKNDGNRGRLLTDGALILSLGAVLMLVGLLLRRKR